MRASEAAAAQARARARDPREAGREDRRHDDRQEVAVAVARHVRLLGKAEEGRGGRQVPEPHDGDGRVPPEGSEREERHRRDRGHAEDERDSPGVEADQGVVEGGQAGRPPGLPHVVGRDVGRLGDPARQGKLAHPGHGAEDLGVAEAGGDGDGEDRRQGDEKDGLLQKEPPEGGLRDLARAQPVQADEDKGRAQGNGVGEERGRVGQAGDPEPEEPAAAGRGIGPQVGDQRGE